MNKLSVFGSVLGLPCSFSGNYLHAQLQDYPLHAKNVGFDPPFSIAFLANCFSFLKFCIVPIDQNQLNVPCNIGNFCN